MRKVRERRHTGRDWLTQRALQSPQTRHSCRSDNGRIVIVNQVAERVFDPHNRLLCKFHTRSRSCRGLLLNRQCGPAAWFTVNALLEALVKPLALAVNCLLPAVSMRKLVKLTAPFPAAVPMSCAVVPCNVPVPDERVIVTGRLAGNPTDDALPN